MKGNGWRFFYLLFEVLWLPVSFDLGSLHSINSETQQKSCRLQENLQQASQAGRSVPLPSYTQRKFQCYLL